MNFPVNLDTDVANARGVATTDGANTDGPVISGWRACVGFIDVDVHSENNVNNR